MKELTTTFPPDTLKPSTEADVIFSTMTDAATACRNYGQVLTHNALPDPWKCHATGKGIETAVVREMSTAIVQTINFKSQPYEGVIQSLECELVSEISGTRTRGIVERRGESHYEISYQPTIKGRHKLHVKVEGRYIRGSPFTISVMSPEKLGTPILTLRGVRRPWGVAINQRGEVIVTEWIGNCVSVFSPSGKKLRTFGTSGSGQGQFESPRGVAVDGDGYILVTDRSNHRIQKFTPEGQFLTAVGARGKGPLQFGYPTDIAFSAANQKIYVTDSWNHRVQVLNSDLTFSSSFGKPGNGKGQFDYPHGLACDSTGKVYVADHNNHQVQVFTTEGKFLKMFGRCGDGRGELRGPEGVAIDSNNIVYVSELDNHCVSVFTSEGVFVTSFGSRGEGPGQFECPYGIAVDNSGVVYVCDHNNDRLVFY